MEQGSLFSVSSSDSTLPGGDRLLWFKQWIPAAEADQWGRWLLTQVQWAQPSVRVAGKTHRIPREQAWYADQPAAFTYSGTTFHSLPLPAPLSALRDAVSALAGVAFNSVLVNHYRDGRDGVGWHADDEAEFGPEPCIASLSFGACRAFQLKPKAHYREHAQWQEGQRPISLPLAHGDLLIMPSGVQSHWLHSVPKRSGIDQWRINLTFRQVI